MKKGNRGSVTFSIQATAAIKETIASFPRPLMGFVAHAGTNGRYPGRLKGTTPKAVWKEACKFIEDRPPDKVDVLPDHGEVPTPPPSD